MQQVRKKLLSWLWPVPEGRSTSPLNPYLEWRWENGKLVLNTRLANYSYGSLHKVMRKAIRMIPAGRRHRILLLGVGGGSALRLLASIPNRVASIDAVDADPEIIRLAKSVFGIKENALLRLHVADALVFAKDAPAAAYDIVIEDVFIDLGKPAFCMEPDYFAALQRLLAPGGKLILNSMPKDYNEHALWQTRFLQFFEEVSAVRIAGSNQLWNGTRP